MGAPTAGETGHLADHGEHPVYVDHGATAGTARPTLGSGGNAAAVCFWDGSVAPDNGVTGDYWYDDANDVWKRYDGSSWVSSGASGAPAYGFRTGWYYTPFASTKSTGSPGEQVALAAPFQVGRTTTFDRIGASVTGAGTAGAVVRLGIYDAGDNGHPDALVLDAGTIDGTSATAQEITVSQELTSGWYWLVAVIQGGAGTRPTMRTLTGVTSFGGEDSLALVTSTALRTGLFKNSFASGALPANFGTPDGPAGQMILTALRAA